MQSEEHLTAEGLASSSAKLFPQGSVALAMYGATIGKASILGVEAATNQACAVGIPLCVSSQFLHYYLVSQANALASAGQGGAQPNISQGVVRSWPIGLPPLREQDRIVDALDEALSGNDAAAAELLSAKRKLGRLRQSLLKSAIEGTLTADWRVQGCPASSDSAGMPRDWRLLAINDIGTVQLGRQRSPDKVGGSSPTPYIRAANITEKGVDLRDVLAMDFSPTEVQTFALQPGDVLLTEASGSAEHVGRPAIWPPVDGVFCFQNTVVRFRPKSVSSKFAYFLFLAQQKLGVFANLSAGVGINHLSAGKFGRLPVPVPPHAEQMEIVDRLEAAFDVIDDQERTIAWSMARANAQRQNILRAAFSGQLAPQDPNDEPASVLLDRIRAQRPASATAAKRKPGRPAKVAA